MELEFDRVTHNKDDDNNKYFNYYWGGNICEEDYYASQGIRGSSSFFTSPHSGLSLFTRSWLPLSGPTPKALICLVHGYGNDISWTFQSTAIFLARNGFACFALDLPGHGRSPGLHAFVPDIDSVAEDCIAFFNFVKQKTSTTLPVPSFLYGESMGGALCLLIHLKEKDRQQQQSAAAASLMWSGAILVAPMCKIAERIKPRWPIPVILTFLSKIAPTLPIVPTPDLLEKSVKVPEKMVIADRNPRRYRGKPRLGTVVELLRATDQIGKRLQDVTLPFLVLHGDADVVTDPSVSKALYETASSEDKSIQMYDGMLHSLLYGETDENIEVVRKDILHWLNHRC